MAKQKKEIITEDGHVFDSMEELYFYWWVKELMDNGFIEKFVSQPEPFTLSSGLKMPYIKEMKKVANKELWKDIIEPSVYTCDGLIKWNKKAEFIFYFDFDVFSTTHKGFGICKDKKMLELFVLRNSQCFIEVKPFFDQNNMTRLAKTNIKWVWDKHQEFVNLIVPSKLFMQTFTPKRYLRSDKDTTDRKIHFKVRSLEQFLESKQDNQMNLL